MGSYDKMELTEKSCDKVSSIFFSCLLTTQSAIYWLFLPFLHFPAWVNWQIFSMDMLTSGLCEKKLLRWATSLLPTAKHRTLPFYNFSKYETWHFQGAKCHLYRTVPEIGLEERLTVVPNRGGKSCRPPTVNLTSFRQHFWRHFIFPSFTDILWHCKKCQI